MHRREGVVMCANFGMRVEAGGGERTKTREKLGRGGKERAEERKAGKKREKIKSVELFLHFVPEISPRRQATR